MQATSRAPRPEVTSTGSTDQTVDSVLHAMLSVGRLMRQHAAGDPLDPASFWLLKNLAEDAMRVTDLASCSHLDPSTVSRHLTQLERTGLIERSPDLSDRRAQRVDLSGEGRRQLQAAMDRRRDLLVRSFEGWPDHDIDTLDRLLARFVDSIEHVTTDPQDE